MILKERVQRKKLKEAISKESAEFDLLFDQCQKFAEKCTDPDKIEEMLNLLDESKRKTLVDILNRKKLMS